MDVSLFFAQTTRLTVWKKSLDRRAWDRSRGRNQHWINYVKKHGNPIVEIVHNDLTLEQATNKEQYYIKIYGRIGYEENGILVNKSEGGESGSRGIKWSKQSIEDRNQKLQGRIFTPEHSFKISLAKQNHPSYQNMEKNKKQKVIHIGKRPVGDGHPAFIIAEAGINHNGKIDLAKKLIDIAVEAKADAVKFQMRDFKTLYTDTAFNNTKNEDIASQYLLSLIRESTLSEKNFTELAKYAEKKGIMFLCTPWEKIKRFCKYKFLQKWLCGAALRVTFK
jgi:hypothetical protein